LVTARLRESIPRCPRHQPPAPVAKRFPVRFDQKVKTHDLERPSISRA